MERECPQMIPFAADRALKYQLPDRWAVVACQQTDTQLI